MLESGVKAKLLDEFIRSGSVRAEKWIVDVRGGDPSSGLLQIDCIHSDGSALYKCWNFFEAFSFFIICLYILYVGNTVAQV